MGDDENFEKADAGASKTFPISAGNLKKGDFVCIKDHPCKVIDISTSKTGKHGHAKANITAVDIFTAKKYEEVCPTSHSLPAPFVTRKEYQLLDITPDNRLSLMDDDGSPRDDLNLPLDPEVADPLKSAFDAGKALVVVVLSAMGVDAVIGSKEDPNQK